MSGSKNGHSRKLRTRTVGQFPWNCGFCFAANARYARRILRLHADRLSPASASIAASTDQFHSACSIFFVMAWANVGPGGDFLGELQRFLQHLFGRDQAVEEAPRDCLVRGHGRPVNSSSEGTPLTDDSRQDRAGTHVAPASPTRVNKNGRFRPRRTQPKSDDMARMAPAPRRPSTQPRSLRTWRIAFLAMSSDFRLGTPRAKTAFLFTRVGLAGCDMGACAILPRIIGQGAVPPSCCLPGVPCRGTSSRRGLLQPLDLLPEEVLQESLQLAEESPPPTFAMP